ncbi:iron(III) ABC transporter ATP-binding component [Agrilactobacillus composti DSM 18527 = JCM 14202]|uniref:Iron(III) ABC transporter ATP-binding component n=1 Tax=Agrilactobacillus composti DSM 18527 = JCM 14202 TaxID=1423734 RepID=X0PFX7_9LACO|nr:ABC transporter ATP-binding protein [Agrilactobacillus composti]KRM33305.1 iron(III) ABC transporter ATP-binding component [Agrilactobacillus composti DSM 18527 = JCM 14202]GAF40723.1 ABC transporter related [Agrilactobacillus composti DSM 18527 = JCM 14202]
MLTLKDVSVHFGKKQVLKNISFNLDFGQSVCLLGQNGAGKTTLFRTILNTIAYSGQVLINDQPTKALSRIQLAQKIAYIPQNHEVPVDFTVFEMVLLGTTAKLKTFQQPGPKEVAQAKAALNRLGIAHLQDMPFSQISGGEQQLVTIARSLAQNSRVIIMDEPCANLDFGNQTLVLEMIRQLTQQGLLILQSTHDPNQALRYADQILLLESGHLSSGAPKEILTSARLSALYGMPVQVFQVTVDGEEIQFCLAKKGGLPHVANL